MPRRRLCCSNYNISLFFVITDFFLLIAITIILTFPEFLGYWYLRNPILYSFRFFSLIYIAKNITTASTFTLAEMENKLIDDQIVYVKIT